MGAVLNQRPDLFGAALPAVGVMDMLRFHQFTDRLGLESTTTAPPDDPAEFKALYAYSPLPQRQARDAVPGRRSSPPPTTTTAWCPAHSFKFAAALQAAQAGDAPVLIRIETRGRPRRGQAHEQDHRGDRRPLRVPGGEPRHVAAGADSQPRRRRRRASDGPRLLLPRESVSSFGGGPVSRR